MKLLAIDGNSILNRAFYGIRPLSNTQGVFTHAIFGFMNIYLKNRDEVQPDAVAVAFDLRKPTFRHKAVATYKANRKGMPEELAMQLPYVKQLLTLLGIPVITCEGYEADDILGTLAAACTAQDADCVILTGDRDSLQLVSDHVTVRLTTNKETIPYTPERFQEEYGFAPLSLIDLKALMGDSSDNISGVAGVGQKTASKLIQAWGTVENLYVHLDEAGLTKSVYNKLTAGQDLAKESKWLATIVTDVPIDMDVQHYLPQPVQTEEVRRLLLELEMAKLLEKLKLSGTDAPAAEAAEPAEQQQPLTEQPLTAALLDTWRADKTELPCCLFDGSRICVYHAGTPEAVYTSADTALWEQLFQMPRLTFGAKPQYRFLLAQGITPDSGSPAAKDAELAAYLLNSTTSAYEVERLCVTYHVPYPRSAGEYADLVALPKLYAAMEKLVEEQGMTRLLHFEQQLTVVLAAMEHDGIAIDRQGVEDFGVYLSEQIEEMQQMVYDEAGHTFNIGSPKQLGEVLFGEMQLPHGKKTKTGWSTNADVLEKLRYDAPIVADVLRYRQYAKLKSTYVDGLLKVIDPDGRVRTSFQMTVTATGRLSSTEPNLQNIPTRTELGSQLRRMFTAPEGCVLVDADYSQIELRLLAHIAEDTEMQAAFRSGADFHTVTASRVFHVPPEEVTPEMRRRAKAVNFGIVYGISAFSLAQDIGVSVAEAKAYMERYFETYQGVRQYMTDVVVKAEQDGYVQTLMHRRRALPELKSSNFNLREFGKRVALNMPVQGTAADIMKLAMVRVHRRLKREGLRARLLMQVHDELIVECPASERERVERLLTEEMEQAASLSVPLIAEAHSGKNWLAAKE